MFYNYIVLPTFLLSLKIRFVEIAILDVEMGIRITNIANIKELISPIYNFNSYLAIKLSIFGSI